MMYSNEAIAQIDSTLSLPNDIDGDVRIQVSAIPDYDPEKAPSEFFTVYVKNNKDEYNVNAIHGKYRDEDGYLSFTPSFPFERGLAYVVKFKNSAVDDGYAYQSFEVGTPQVYDTAKVLGIYPLAAELPENVLRFYLYFNTPMKKGEGLAHVQLVDAAGNIDNQAFMQFKQELWSADGKRLTILFDPGRIKRGVSTNVDLGPALIEGEKFKLTISSKWKDVYGNSLAMDFTKEFKVVKAYRAPIELKNLDITEPEESTVEPLVIDFDRVMDHALIQSMIRIERKDGNPVLGNWEISEDETKALFFPEEEWKKGSYKVFMNSQLEDVSGNNLSNLLDQKLNSENEMSPMKLSRIVTI